MKVVKACTDFLPIYPEVERILISFTMKLSELEVTTDISHIFEDMPILEAASKILCSTDCCASCMKYQLSIAFFPSKESDQVGTIRY